MKDLKDKIWITCKTRMNSEKRYRLYDHASYLCLAYMSFLMIAANLLAQKFPGKIPYIDLITVAIPLFLFALTLVIYGYRFSKTADQFRECYLKLQALEQTFESENDAAATYQLILSSYPNHLPWDYENLLIDRTLFGNDSIRVGDSTKTWTVTMLIKKILRNIVFLSLVCGLPAATTFLLLYPFL